MSYAGYPDETPEVEDINGTDNQSDAGHEVTSSDEGDDIDGDGDEGSRAADAVQDDDDGSDDGEENRQDQVVPKKGNREFGVLRQRARAAEQERDELRNRLEALERNQNRRDPAVEEAERRARLELMSPDEKIEYLLKEQDQRYRNEIAQMRFEQADVADKTRFDGLCARNPVFADLADDVETELLKLRRQGGNSSREVIAKFILGDRAVQRAARVKGRQQKQATQNVSRQQARPTRSRSDVAGGDERRGGNDRISRFNRIKDIPI